MNLPKIAEAVQQRAIPEHKMWFNPLAPVAKPTVPAGTEALTGNPASAPEEAASSKGAPVKEAEAIVPKPELPKVVSAQQQQETPSLAHNL